MKTTLRPDNSRRTSVAAALALAVFGAALLGGVSVQAAGTNFIWSVSSGAYTNDANWLGQTNFFSTQIFTNIEGGPSTFAPCGNNPTNRAPAGSVNYIAWITNTGTINYGDGGAVASTPYTWTNFLGGLFIGTNGGTGQFNLSSCSLTVSNNGASGFTIGPGVGSTGTFNMTGGSLLAARNAVSQFQDYLIIGDSPDDSGVGTFTISGGLARVFGGIEIGTGGNGTFNMNGGVFIDNGWFGVGRGGTAGTNGSGTFNMTAGTMYIMRNAGNDGSGNDNGLYMGQGASNAVANISGGTLYCIRFAGMGGSAGGMQTLNISGGTIYVGYLGSGTNGLGVESANISGGTFHTLDMVTNTVANFGNTNLAVLADGTNWTWAANPPINLTNNTFLVNGVSGPGNVTFAPEANRTITLNNQWTGVGSMVINGLGSVAMGEANGNNYTGGTTVSQGTLIFNTAQPSGLISGVSLSSGTTLALASAQTNPIIGVATIPSGSTLELNNNGVFYESPVNIPSGVLMAFNQSGSATVTNVFTGTANIVMQGSGTVTVSNNLQNTGWIVQSNGALVVNGSILNASGVTNNGPIAAGPFCAQGLITPPLTISSNSVIDLGTPVYVGTLYASNVNLNGAWNCKLNTATTVGSGVNDLLICSNLVIGPNSTLNIVPQTPLSVGTYVLAEYSGTLSGTFNTVSNSTHDVLSVSYTTPNEILLTVSANNTNNLTWAAPIVTGGNINWDVLASQNWTNTATAALSTFGQGDTVNFNLFTNGAGGVTNRVNLVGQVLPAAININGGAAYIFSGFGYISGGAGLNYNDTNTSGIYTSGNNYTGTVNVNAGVLQLGSGGSSWLGTTDGPTVINGGTLDLNAQNVGAEPLMIQGNGLTTGATNGAINNSSGTASGQSGGPLNITLNGDTTLNASGARWDIGIATPGAGGGSFTGNSHNLVKIGAQPIWMHEVGDIGVSNIDIQKGLLGFEYTIGMGVPTGTVTVEPGATLGIFQLNTNSMLNKELILNNNATLSSGGGTGSSNNFIGPVTLNGTNFITTSSFPLVLTNVISGSGGFILANPGPLYLGGVDTYTGPTVINTNSRIVLMPGGSIADSPLIELVPATNSVLDAGTNTLTFGSSQTVMGTGYIIATNATAGATVTLTPGTNLVYGTLIFTNSLTLNGDTNDLKLSDYNNVGVDNDLIMIGNTLNLSGQSTIVVTPIGALSPGNPYTAMVAGSVNGPVSNLKVVSTSPRYSMTAALNGSDVQINVTGNPAPLRWVGNLTPNWDLITSNWFNLSASVQDHFYNGDDPIFDDSSTVNNVTITNSLLLPAGIFMSNVVKTYTFNGGGVIAGQMNMYGNGSSSGGMVVLAMSNAPSFTAVDSHYGTLVYNLVGTSNYTVHSIFEDTAFTGSGKVIFGGTNIALLEADNYDAGFDGEFLVTNGVLRYTNADAFGTASTSLAMTNNGTLDFNQVPLGSTFTVHIAGNGFNGEGALFDSTNNQEPNGAVTFMTLDGNASVGSPTGDRWDVHVPTGSPGQVNGNGFKLTKVGGGTVFFYDTFDGDTHFGDIDVVNGRLGFEGSPSSGYSIALGNPANVLSIESNQVVTFYAISNGQDTVYNGISKVMWLKGYEASIDSGGGSNNLTGPLFLSGTNLIGTRSDLHLWNTIMDSNGPGGLILANDTVGANAADLWLDGTNSYSGPTIISNRTVHVGVNSSLGLSTLVQVNNGGGLDLSATPNYNFGTTLTNQTMIGNGIVAGPASGNLNFNAGGTLAIGLPSTNGLVNTNTYTLSISNSVVFNAGSTNYVVANKTNPNAGAVPADQLAGPTSLTLGGTIVVTNFGTNFVGGDVLTLYSATTITTNSYTIVPATPGPNLVWNINSIPVNGTLSVVSTFSGPSFTNPPPITVSSVNNQLALAWPSKYVGYYYLQYQSNSVSTGLSNNWLPYGGSIGATLNSPGITNALSSGPTCVFYRLMTNAP